MIGGAIVGIKEFLALKFLVLGGLILFVALLVLLGILLTGKGTILPPPVYTRPEDPKDRLKAINDPEKNGDIPAKGGKLPPIHGIPKPP